MNINKFSDESRRNAFLIDAKFMNSHITAQEMLADAAKRSEKISQASPQPFNRIGVSFKDIIFVIIPRPFLAAMCDCGMLTLDTLIRLVFVGEDMTI